MPLDSQATSLPTELWRPAKIQSVIIYIMFLHEVRHTYEAIFFLFTRTDNRRFQTIFLTSARANTLLHILNSTTSCLILLGQGSCDLTFIIIITVDSEISA